ncbi:hypothetical protein Fmac_014609 [Flemingia macrophylla]|uniref:Protein kinase domain-containing protein n=1 Tax=Flemingia macrophylla TaxID=520843 RepID=A0ABD1MC79_9FABA
MGSDIDMDDITDDAFISYSWRVESAIKSETASYYEASSVHSFGSVVDRAIRSGTSTMSMSNSGTSPVPSFASTEDNVITWNARGHVPARLFRLAELEAATDHFSFYKISAVGRFGVVYRTKLFDGREVAIKRALGRLIQNAILAVSLLNHKNLVGLVGFCGENHHRFSVYEYMKNASLYDHLHRKFSTVLHSWKMRIKVALDASRGIEYLHNYAVPSIIHGRVKSANILLDATWTARVTDFELSFLSPKRYRDYRPMDAAVARSVGYIDPEYYGLNKLTPKSDVYGFGVVLLELLTGKEAIFEYGEDGDTSLISLVDVAVPAILDGNLVDILDSRVGPPDVNEALAVEAMANTAIRCVSLKAKNRPTMAEIVLNLGHCCMLCQLNSDQL